MNAPSYIQFPDVSGGYALEGEQGWFSVLVPEAMTNLVANPSFETGVSGYTQVGAGTFAASASRQRRGAKSGKVQIQNNNEGIYYTASLVSGTVYTFSLDVYGYPGARYSIQAEAVGGATVLGRKLFTGKGYWERVDVTFTAPSTSSFALALYCADIKTAHYVYTDGWQCEASTYPTSYIDGDLTGFLAGQAAYYWHGVPHSSQSTRIYNTGSGGKEMNLLDIGFRILAVLGLGLAPYISAATSLSTGGAYYQRSVLQTRQFTLVGAITGFSLADLDRRRAELLSAVQPGRLPSDQPLTLRYHRVDDSGAETEVVNITAVFEGGMEGSVDNFNQQRIGLTFRQYLPFIQGDGEIGYELDFADTLGTANGIFYRDPDGAWTLMGSGIGTGEFIYDLAQAPDGKIYAAGSFASIDGVAADSIAYWDGTGWTSLSSSTNGDILTICFDPSGNLYAGGEFTSIDGVAATRVAKWNGTTWSALDNGLDNSVRDLLFAPDGVLYAAGSFDHSGATDINSIAYWTGAAWAQLGTPPTSLLAYSLAYNAGILYVAGGPFMSYSDIISWDGSAWSDVGTGLGPGVRVIAFGPDGRLYAGGNFTQSGGTYAADAVAVYNGTSWEQVGSGFASGYYTSDAIVYDLSFTSDGAIYAAGDIQATGDGVTVRDLARYAGTEWTQPDYDMAYDPINLFEIHALLATIDGRLYVGGCFVLTGKTAAGVTTVQNDHGAAYPVIEFTGPGAVIGITNNTTGASIYFKNLTLLSGERVRFVTDPLNFSITSNIRGSLANYLLASSPTQFMLAPGENSISLLITGTDAASSAVLHYHPNYLSLDGATR